MRIIIFIIFMFSTVYIFSQESIFKNYNTDDGLPSSEVHDIYKDKKGYLWFATDNGITRFDGKSFKTFGKNLPSSVFFNFFEESTTRVWVSTLKNKLYSFNPIEFPLEFKAYKYNDTLGMLFDNYNNRFIRNIWKDSLNNLNFSFLNKGGKFTISPSGDVLDNYNIELKKHRSIYNEHDFTHINIFFNKSKDINFAYTELVYDSISPGQIILKERDKIYDTSIKYKFNIRSQYGISDYIISNSNIFLIIGKYLIHLDENNSLACQELNSEGLKLKIIDEKLYVCTYKGCEVYNKELVYLTTHLPKYTITAVNQDHENGIWFSTTTNGIFYTKQIDIVKYINNENYIYSSLIVYNDFIIGATINKEVLRFTKQNDLIAKYSKVNYKNNIYSSFNEENLDGVIGKLHLPNYQYFETLKLYIPFNSNHEDYKILVNNKCIYTFDDRAYTIDSLEVPFINDLIKLEDSSILLFTKKGLFSYSRNKKKAIDYGKYNSILKVEMVTGQLFKSGILINTKNHGIIYLTKEKSLIINEQNGLCSNNINCSFVKDDSIVWIGTKKGVDMVCISEQLDYNIKHLSTSTGLINNEIIDLYSYQDSLWISTKKGINVFPEKIELKPIEIDSNFFFIDSIRINNQLEPYNHSPITLNEDDKIEFYINQLTYKYEHSLTYEYRIPTMDSTWSSTINNHLTFHSLQIGSNVLEMKVNYDNDIKGKVHQIKINVLPPLTKSWWAILFYSILIVGFIYLLFIILLNRIKNKKQIEVDKLNLELKALISQMNPHFTFNSINTIQYYILKNDKKEAMLYLSEFAGLMRKTLDYSRKEYILLTDEIEFLELYAKLENKRFDEPFILNIKTELISDIINIKVPALLLQPLLENAIIHGVNGIDSDGLITISFKEFSSYLIISIQDNGNGIKCEKVVKDRKSHGLDILTQRIKLYNGIKYKTNDILFESNENGIDGTRVQIKLYKN